MSKGGPNRVPERVPEMIAEKFPERIPERVLKKVPNVPKVISKINGHMDIENSFE